MKKSELKQLIKEELGQIMPITSFGLSSNISFNNKYIKEDHLNRREGQQRYIEDHLDDLTDKGVAELYLHIEKLIKGK